MNWFELVAKLRSLGQGECDLHPPCPDEDVRKAEAKLGPIPTEIRTMLYLFNGGEVFINAIPMVTLFGIRSSSYTLPEGMDIVAMTSQWRSTRPLSADWVFGMTNYEGYLVFDSVRSKVLEWDAQLSRLSTASEAPELWRDRLFAEGLKYMND